MFHILILQKLLFLIVLLEAFYKYTFKFPHMTVLFTLFIQVGISPNIL